VPSRDGEVPSLEERRALAEHLTDPLNRLFRYPAAHALLRIAGGLPLRPDHITYLHTTSGILGAALIAWGGRWALAGAFVLLEVRMVLDCYDGVLARAKNLSSPRGRTMDELGDALAYVAIVIGMSVHLYRTRHDLSPAAIVALGLALVAAGALSGHAYDFNKRRFGSALKDGRDAIAEELALKEQLARAGGARWITRFGIWFDRWQVRLYSANVRNGDTAATITARAGTPAMRVLVRLIGLLSWDNMLGAISIGVLLDRIFEVELLALAYGLLMFTTTRVVSWRVLGKRGVT
jgi:phosphatidylglycerophosphate synthase